MKDVFRTLPFLMISDGPAGPELGGGGGSIENAGLKGVTGLLTPFIVGVGGTLPVPPRPVPPFVLSLRWVIVSSGSFFVQSQVANRFASGSFLVESRPTAAVGCFLGSLRRSESSASASDWFQGAGTGL